MQEPPQSASISGWFDSGLAHLWPPYCQVKTMDPPLALARIEGTQVHLADGRVLIDGISSWWAAVHGYNHPHIRAAIEAQLRDLPHFMLGGAVHEQALKLATRLARLLPGDLNHVFFSESGSIAVEVAMKMAVQYWRNRGDNRRARFIAFEGGYHGDSFATMSICDPDEGMHSLFAGALQPQYIRPLPRDDNALDELIALARKQDDIAGVIVEPLLQGAGGMLVHDNMVLQRLRKLCDETGLLLIFDEIFTGFGRTGAMFAAEKSGVTPDIITLGKALTGGFLPLAATIASAQVFAAFYSDEPGHALMHGPTFMGNALGCAAANGSLDLFEQEPGLEQIAAIEAHLRAGFAPFSAYPQVRDVRVLGAMAAVELEQIGSLNAMKRRLVELGVFVRPFGRTLYLTPAYSISPDDLDRLIAAIDTLLQEGPW